MGDTTFTTVNSDHDAANKHEEFYDLQKFTLPADKSSTAVSIKVIAQNGEAKDNRLVIYRQSEATTINKIEVSTKDNEGNITGTYPAFLSGVAGDTQNYSVIIPEGDFDKVNITATPKLEDVATVTFNPQSVYNESRTNTEVGAYTYEDYILDNTVSTEEPVRIEMEAGGLVGAPYVLTIIKVKADKDPFVSVDNSNAIEPTLEEQGGQNVPMYVYSVADDAETAKVTITTVRANGVVNVDGATGNYTLTTNVNVTGIGPEGYIDIPMSVTSLGTTNSYTLRLYKASADARLDKITVNKLIIDPYNVINPPYEAEYDIENGKYVVKVKNDTEYVKISAVAEQATSPKAKVGIGKTEEEAKNRAQINSGLFQFNDISD